MNLGKKDVTVVLPTLDEEESIGPVIDELHGEGFENLLVVDGHSADSTVEKAKKRGVDVIYQEGEGKAEAVKTGIRKVETPYLVVMDADWTYPAEDVPKLLEEAEDSDHVVGKREDRENIPLLHRLGNWGINRVFNTLMETDFEDILSGMYVLNAGRAADLEFPFSGFECEVTICAQLAEETKEVPIGYREREGEKELSGFRGLKKILEATYTLSKEFGSPSRLRRIAASIMIGLGILGGLLLTRLGKIGSFLD